MPQLDKFSFASQFFIISYFVILNFFLPRILAVLRLRNSKLNNLKTSIHHYWNEEILVLNSFGLVLNQQINYSEQIFSKIEKSFMIWFNNSRI